MHTGWWLADTLHEQGLFALLTWVFWVIFSITLHELGHGVAAIRVGDDTPIRTGHMSLNPLVHMGPTSLIIFAVVGVAWGAMPVNPYRFRGWHADARVALAGPAVNVGLWLLCVLGLVLAGKYGSADSALAENLTLFFWTGAYLNLVLLVLNLVPVPPLDGSRALASFSPAYTRLADGPNAAMFSLVGILFVFFVAADTIFSVSSQATAWAVVELSGILPG